AAIPLFTPTDLKDPTGLAVKLHQPKGDDPAAGYLRLLLSAETRQLLAEYDVSAPLPGPLRQALAADLSGLLQTWTARRDLLTSQPNDRHVVVEMNNDGRGQLRFGDGELGRRPEAGEAFWPTYRVGNGPAGNVGAEAICHIVFDQFSLSNGIKKIRNPLPAQGGIAPEPLDQVKLFAPYAFRADLQRAITPPDYADLVMRQFGAKVQRAAAALRWTGSWYEVLVAIDPLGQVEANPALLQAIDAYLHRYRRMGHDVVVKSAQPVALDVALTICILPNYLRGHVKAALLDLFSSRRLPDGRLGFFHPDNLTFGEGIRVSQLVALARSAPGVENVTVTRLQRYDEWPNQELEQGILRLGPLEVARLDNDPNFPENGLLELEMVGGR
ncbi:MAG: putative baseplate assembly protein, partial [Chloroflexota bacterium]